MARVSSSDLRAVLRCIGELGDVDEVESFPDRMLGSLNHVIPSDTLCYDEVSPRGMKILTRHLPADAVPAQEEAACRMFSHQNPVVSHLVQTRDPRPLKASDFLSQREFQRLEIYQACYHPLGWEHQLMVLLPSPKQVLRALLFNRRTSDYSERDRDIAELVRPHIATAYRKAQTRSHLRRILGNLVHTVEARDEGLVLLGSDWRVTLATPRASDWLAFYFGQPAVDGSRLPAALDRFVRRERSRSGDRRLSIPDGTMIFWREDRRLEVRYVPLGKNGGDDALLLEEQQDPGPARTFEANGLTRREVEVLVLTAEGKTNEEIANVLFVSRRTIDKHLEHIYEKLGVHSRTAAVWALTVGRTRWTKS